jgi:hypothetical protein
MKSITPACALTLIFAAGCQQSEPELVCGLGDCFYADGSAAVPKELGLTELENIIWACELTETPPTSASPADTFFLRLYEEGGNDFPYCYSLGFSDALSCFRRAEGDGAELFEGPGADDGRPIETLLINPDRTAQYEEYSTDPDTDVVTTRTYTGNCVKGEAY